MSQLFRARSCRGREKHSTKHSATMLLVHVRYHSRQTPHAVSNTDASAGPESDPDLKDSEQAVRDALRSAEAAANDAENALENVSRLPSSKVPSQVRGDH
jgi:hypothetical protein